jgi:hypothetical protein
MYSQTIRTSFSFQGIDRRSKGRCSAVAEGRYRRRAAVASQSAVGAFFVARRRRRRRRRVQLVVRFALVTFIFVLCTLRTQISRSKIQLYNL